MSDSKSPIICVTCKRPFPEDLTADDAPKYFAQEPIFPRSDDDGSFVNETHVIMDFIASVTFITSFAPEVTDAHYKTVLELLFQLSEEAKRRLELVDAALREKWNRDHGPDTQTQEAGRA